MSRTYRFRNKDNKPNKFIKDYFSGCYHDREEVLEEDSFYQYLRRGHISFANHDKRLRRHFSKSASRRYDQYVKKMYRNGQEDDIVSPNHASRLYYNWIAY